jgi:hypothetical protein
MMFQIAGRSRDVEFAIGVDGRGKELFVRELELPENLAVIRIDAHHQTRFVHLIDLAVVHKRRAVELFEGVAPGLGLGRELRSAALAFLHFTELSVQLRGESDRVKATRLGRVHVLGSVDADHLVLIDHGRGVHRHPSRPGSATAGCRLPRSRRRCCRSRCRRRIHLRPSTVARYRRAEGAVLEVRRAHPGSRRPEQLARVLVHSKEAVAGRTIGTPVARHSADDRDVAIDHHRTGAAIRER